MAAPPAAPPRALLSTKHSGLSESAVDLHARDVAVRGGWQGVRGAGAHASHEMGGGLARMPALHALLLGAKEPGAPAANACQRTAPLRRPAQLPTLLPCPSAWQLPGLWRQRKREVKELEEEAGAPGGWVGWFQNEQASVCVRGAEVEEGRVLGPRPPHRPWRHPWLPISAVIWAAWLNRGTNFSREEREALRLEGLLPPVVESLDLQAE